jgi:cell division protein FtsW (lipid II flippase)
VQAANALKPSIRQVTEGLTHMDFIFKCEMFLVCKIFFFLLFQYDLQSALYWSSGVEVCMFILGLIMFIGSPAKMAYIWLHVGHFFRGVLGFVILDRLPKSHDIVD